MNWDEIPGWFRWRVAQQEAVDHFGDGSRFVPSPYQTTFDCGSYTCIGLSVQPPRPSDFASSPPIGTS